MKSALLIFYAITLLSLEAAPTTGNSETTSKETLKIAEKLRFTGNFNKAIELLESDISLLSKESVINHALILEFKLALGETLLRKEFHQNVVSDTAYDLFIHCKEQANQNKLPGLEARALNALGFYNFKKGEDHLDTGLKLLKQARNIIEQTGDSLTLCKNLYYTGIIH